MTETTIIANEHIEKLRIQTGRRQTSKMAIDKPWDLTMGLP